MPLAQQQVKDFPVEITTITIDSFQAENPVSALFGTLKDTTTGIIKSWIYAQFSFQGANLSLGDPNKLQLDSLILQIPVFTRFGDAASPMRIKVYQIIETWQSSTYGINDSLQIHPIAVVDTVVQFSEPFEDVENKILRLRCSDSLGNVLLFAGDANYTSATAFKNYFKGLAITAEIADPTAMGVVYATIATNLSFHLELHYHEDTAQKSITFYTFAAEDRFFHRIVVQKDSTAVFEEALRNDALLGFRGGALYVPLLTLPRVDSLLALQPINRGLLYLYAIPEYVQQDFNLAPPAVAAIHLYRVDAEGKPYAVKEASLTSASWDSLNQRYVIDVTNLLQSLQLGGSQRTQFIILPGGFRFNLSRVVLGGKSHPQYAPKLKILYAKLP